MHLFLAQSVNLISGTKGATQKEENLLLNQVQNQRREAPIMISFMTAKGDHVKPEQSRGVILSYLLKGEPPDAPHLTKQQAYQGKTLNSQKRMNANLLSLGAGNIVSRTKPFQEGEYDEDIKSSSTKDHGIWRAMEGNGFVVQVGPPQEKAQADQRLLNGGFRPNHEEPSYKPTCLGKLTHQRTNEAWNHTKIHYGLKVIHFLNRRIPDLPYLEAHKINQLQTRLWRPGEASNHQGDILNQLEESYNTFPYTSSHKIRRIILHPNLPYLGVFTLSAINPKRLYLCYNCNLSVDLMNQDVPRHHKFMPKLSRYKEPSNFPYLADFVNQSFNG